MKTSFFSRFFSNTEQKTEKQSETENILNLETKLNETTTPSVEIPEEIFIEKIPETQTATLKTNQMDLLNEKKNDIGVLFEFLERDLEKEGFDDALVNPDAYHLSENLEKIKSQIVLIVAKTKTHYNSYLRKLNFHIESRKRSGLVDTVDELIAEKENIQDELDQVNQIESDALESKGLCLGLIMSYKKGFLNGMSSISTETINKYSTKK
jgi:predicted DNA-binding protein YlxM (UPF0122 family)